MQCHHHDASDLNHLAAIVTNDEEGIDHATDDDIEQPASGQVQDRQSSASSLASI